MSNNKFLVDKVGFRNSITPFLLPCLDINKYLYLLS